ncbi:MAG TPA: hypothetical protein VKA70_20290 [Blastocatellia bacterium]|nr:hypothetical protein [Blastocatellia bacterium]
MKKISKVSEKQNLRRRHPNYPNVVEKVVGLVGLAAFTIGPAFLLALATGGALLPLVWILANDAIGAAFGLMFYRRSARYLPKVVALPAVEPYSNRSTLKKAA